MLGLHRKDLFDSLLEDMNSEDFEDTIFECLNIVEDQDFRKLDFKFRHFFSFSLGKNFVEIQPHWLVFQLREQENIFLNKVKDYESLETKNLSEREFNHKFSKTFIERYNSLSL